jgi:protein-S-isoprenylcysteine O-methyltransferase Ste14
MVTRTLQFHSNKTPSTAPKVAIVVWYSVCMVTGALLTLFSGKQEDPTGSIDRQVTLLACAVIFVARASWTLFAFVKRRIPWWEAAWGGGSIGLVLFFLLRTGLRTPQPLGIVDLPGILLYITGSYLGSASEYSRHLWKARPENLEHLYTEGLFRYCRHINYFGDLLLFAGLGILTRQAWTTIIPVVMAVNFIFFIIPAHDAYLATRYGNEFVEYARRARKLFPFIY